VFPLARHSPTPAAWPPWERVDPAQTTAGSKLDWHGAGAGVGPLPDAAANGARAARRSAPGSHPPTTGTAVLLVTGIDYPGHPWRQTAPALKTILEADERLRVRIVENPPPRLPG
jgi:hypothetical protein